MAEGLQIGELPQKENLTGNELIPFQQGSSNGSMSTATLKKYIGTGGGTGGSTALLMLFIKENSDRCHYYNGKWNKIDLLCGCSSILIGFLVKRFLL